MNISLCRNWKLGGVRVMLAPEGSVTCDELRSYLWWESLGLQERLGGDGWSQLKGVKPLGL